MTRNTVTTAEQLIPDDRFYIQKDKQKTVLEFERISEGEQKFNKSWVICWTVSPSGQKITRRRIETDEQVVFLRNTSDKYAEDIRKITDRHKDFALFSQWLKQRRDFKAMDRYDLSRGRFLSASRRYGRTFAGQHFTTY